VRRTRKAAKHIAIIVHRRFHPGFSRTMLLLLLPLRGPLNEPLDPTSSEPSIPGPLSASPPSPPLGVGEVLMKVACDGARRGSGEAARPSRCCKRRSRRRVAFNTRVDHSWSMCKTRAAHGHAHCQSQCDSRVATGAVAAAERQMHGGSVGASPQAVASACGIRMGHVDGAKGHKGGAFALSPATKHSPAAWSAESIASSTAGAGLPASRREGGHLRENGATKFAAPRCTQ
jgi:hypothetical protein